jgi:hypothetical protein
VKFVLIIVICLLSKLSLAQGRRLSHEDSLEIDRILNEPKLGYVFADKSGYFFSELDYKRALEYIKYRTDSGRFSWPYRMHSNPSTPTYIYLIEHKYKITSEDIRPDCMEELWFTLYDSLMDVEIVKKYGDDFYRNSYAEAVTLDKEGKGLTLPFVRGHQNPGTEIVRVLSFLDTVRFVIDDGPSHVGRELRITFKRNKISAADFGVHAMFFIEAEESRYLKKKIIKKLNSLKWNGATFNDRLVDAIVIYNFNESKMSFWFNQ